MKLHRFTQTTDVNAADKIDAVSTEARIKLV